jgi:hypothetical protein
VIAKKQEEERRFEAWAVQQKTADNYEAALPKIKEAVEKTAELSGIMGYFDEALFRGVELLYFASRASRAIKVEDSVVVNKPEAATLMAGLYKDFNLPTDKRVAKRMFTIVRENVKPEYLPDFYTEIDDKYAGNIDEWVENLYQTSAFASADKFNALLENMTQENLMGDPAMKIAMSIRNSLTVKMMALMPYFRAIPEWQGVYMKGLMAMQPEKNFYPDANFTIRLTYGQVLPYSPRDGVEYKHYTTLRGVIEKEDRSNPLEFEVTDKMKDAYAKSDYGRWGQDGELRVNFLSNNDITGGNSGSPVLNARGELIGLAFDGNWEALSSDVMFDASLQRCINLDIRYLLWTIDKYAGAGYLLDEMVIL